jgi:hypothetical protein
VIVATVIGAVVVALLVTAWLVDRRERRVRRDRAVGVDPTVTDRRKDLAIGACRAFDNDEAARWTAEGRRRP